MRSILTIMASGLLALTATAAAESLSDVAISHTLSNYRTGVLVTVRGGLTERGESLPFEMVLAEGKNPYSGKTSSGLGRLERLPEWVDVRWIETGPEWNLSREEYKALSKEAWAARMQAYKALPVRVARVEVARHIPEQVLDELKRSPPDPGATTLPLKNLRLYFIWTTEGVKVRWKMREGCCKILYEGGDPLPPASSASVGPG